EWRIGMAGATRLLRTAALTYEYHRNIRPSRGHPLDQPSEIVPGGMGPTGVVTAVIPTQLRSSQAMTRIAAVRAPVSPKYCRSIPAVALTTISAMCVPVLRSATLSANWAQLAATKRLGRA